MQHVRGAYIASVCQSEVSFNLSFTAQIIRSEKKDITVLNKQLQLLINNSIRDLIFIKLNIKILHLLAFTNTLFANNKDLLLQIGYVLILEDVSYRANIIYWLLIKYKRVTRSILASELYIIVYRFNISAAVKSTVEQLLQIELPLILCTDSKSLYKYLVKLGTTQEKHFIIDIIYLH